MSEMLIARCSMKKVIGAWFRSAAVIVLAACASGAGFAASRQSVVTVVQPCATRVIVRNASYAAHELSWRDPQSGTLVQRRVPPRPDTIRPHVALVERVPSGAELSIDGRPSTHSRSAAACVTRLPANTPDSIPDDYGMLNALLPSRTAGIRFRGLVVLSFRPTTTAAQRDSIVFAERLEMVGGIRIGDRGIGIWAFWVPDDRDATRSLALAERLRAIPGVGNATQIGFRPSP